MKDYLSQAVPLQPKIRIIKPEGRRLLGCFVEEPGENACLPPWSVPGRCFVLSWPMLALHKPYGEGCMVKYRIESCTRDHSVDLRTPIIKIRCS